MLFNIKKDSHKGICFSTRNGVTHYGSSHIHLKCQPTYSQEDRNQQCKFVPLLQAGTLQITKEPHHLKYSLSNMK